VKRAPFLASCGTFTYARDGNVVSTVTVEEYLYSVVPREMTSSWPPEALAAQAICARTYVLQRSNPRRDYDLVPSEIDQVYVGVRSETPAAHAAVDATRGAVLQFSGRFAQVEYSSCCGGHTESSSAAWGGVPIPYLMGVVCPYCTASPEYRWQRPVALASVAAAFGAQLAACGALRSLALGPADPSGRASSIELLGQNGSVSIKGTVFRLRVGPRVVPSLLLKQILPAPEADEDVMLEGGGLGHGVGMCQWGARGMALQGRTHAEILAFYFPGTDTGML
jgi:stage II sporulation protein D